MVDFGLGLLHGPPAGRNDQFLADLDRTLPQLRGSFRSIWMTDHFQWEGQPTFEAWTVLSYIAARYQLILKWARSCWGRVTAIRRCWR